MKTSNYNKKLPADKKYLSIPVDFCIYGLSNYRINEVKLYIYLKYLFDGDFELNKETLNQIKEGLDIKSDKTAKKYFFFLFRNRWIIKRKGKYRIRGYDFLNKKLKFIRTGHGIFYPDDFPKFKSYAAGLVITFLMRKIKFSKGESERNLGRSSAMVKYNHVPILYLAKFLDIPKSTSYDYIQLAKKDGYINTNQVFADFLLEPGEYNLFKKYGNSDELKKIRRRGGKSVEQMPNRISSEIILKRKPNKNSSDAKQKSEPLV